MRRGLCKICISRVKPFFDLLMGSSLINQLLLNSLMKRSLESILFRFSYSVKTNSALAPRTKSLSNNCGRPMLSRSESYPSSAVLEELNGMLLARALLTKNPKRVKKFVPRIWTNFPVKVMPLEGYPSPNLFRALSTVLIDADSSPSLR